MLIDGEDAGKPAIYTGLDGRNFMRMAKVDYKQLKIGQIVVDQENNSVFGVYDEVIKDKEVFAHLIQRMVKGKRLTNIIKNLK